MVFKQPSERVTGKDSRSRVPPRDNLSEGICVSREPNFRKPECLVICGMEDGLNDHQARALKLENESRHGVKIVGFHWIAKRARSIVSNVVAQEVRVIRDLRIV